MLLSTCVSMDLPFSVNEKEGASRCGYIRVPMWVGVVKKALRTAPGVDALVRALLLHRVWSEQEGWANTHSEYPSFSPHKNMNYW